MKYKRYPKVKDSGVEWIGEIPEEWEVNKLSRLIQFGCPITYGIVQAGEDFPNGVRYIRPADMTEEKGIKKNIELLRTNPSIAKNYERSTVISGDIILSIGPSYGKLMIVSEQYSGCNLTQGTARIVINKENSTRYIFWFLRSFFSKQQWYVSIAGATFRALNLYQLSDTKIFVPSYEEQIQISDFLDRQTTQLDELIAKSKAQIILLEERKQATINQAVTKGLDPSVPMKDSGVEWIGEIPEHWEIKKLKFITKKTNSGVTPKGGSTIYEDKGIPLLRSQNIHFDGLHLDNVVYINEKTHDKMKNSKIHENDVLLNITGASIGRCAIIPNKFGEGNVNQHVCIIRCKNSLTPHFLKYFLSSKSIQNLIASSQVGASREGLTFFEISNFLVPTTSQSEQSQITEFLDKQITQFDELIAKSKAQIILLQEKKQALITAAVTGKIDVRSEVVA